MLADAAAAAHGHEFSAGQKRHTAQHLMVSPLSWPLLAYPKAVDLLSRATTLKFASAASAERTIDVNPTVLEGAAAHGEHSDSAVPKDHPVDSEFTPPKLRKASTTSKISFQLAHPPPPIKHRQRLNIRPKILLQLQQLSDATRLIPVLDVLPSVIFAPKLARKFPSIFRGKDGLGADDLVVVNSEKYDSQTIPNKTGDVPGDGSWDTREIVAAICQSKRRGTQDQATTEICLNHGAFWEATPLPNGAYEFTSVDDMGKRTVARWVPRLPNRRRSQHSGDKPELPDGEQRRLTFSIINPDTRRHPVIATLNRFSIDISKQYSMPLAVTSSSNPFTLPTSPDPVPPDKNIHCKTTEPLRGATIETDDHLRTLIVVTGIWVAFREGYIPNFKYDVPGVLSRASGPTSLHQTRSLSINVESIHRSRTSDPSSPSQDILLAIQAPDGSYSPISPTLDSPLTAPLKIPLPPKRAHSTGTVFSRLASHRRRSSLSRHNVPSPAMFSSEKEVEPDSKANLMIRQKSKPKIQSTGLDDSQRHFSQQDSSDIAASFPTPENPPPTLAKPCTAGTGKKRSGKFSRFFGFTKRTSGIR